MTKNKILGSSIVFFLCMVVGAGVLLYGNGLSDGRITLDMDTKRWKDVSWRYKITINIDTPEGVKSFSTVRNVHVKYKSDPHRATGLYTEYRVTGEAVTIDLGERGVFFAILDSDDSEDILYNAIDGPYMAAHEQAAIENLPAGTKGVVSHSGYPRMIAFTDMNDPLTAVEVMRWKFMDGIRPKREKAGYEIAVNNLEKLFGKGVAIRDITIEMTDEPMTWKVKKYLPWLDRINGRYLTGKSISGAGPLGNVHGGNFYWRENNE